MYRQHPLIEAIRLKKKAIKNKADPKLIKNLEKIISERAQKSIAILRSSEFISKILDED